VQFSRIRFLGCTHIRANLHSYPLQGPVVIALSEVGSRLPDPACPARVSCVGCVLPSGPSPCGWLSQPPTTMPDKTPRWYTAANRLPGCSSLDDSTRAHAVSGLITLSCPNTEGVIISLHPGACGASRVLERLSSYMPWPEDSGGHRCSRGDTSTSYHIAFQHVKTVGIRISYFEAVPALQGTRFPLRPTRFSVYAYPILLFAGYPTPQWDQHSIRAGR